MATSFKPQDEQEIRSEPENKNRMNDKEINKNTNCSKDLKEGREKNMGVYKARTDKPAFTSDFNRISHVTTHRKWSSIQSETSEKTKTGYHDDGSETAVSKFTSINLDNEDNEDTDSNVKQIIPTLVFSNGKDPYRNSKDNNFIIGNSSLNNPSLKETVNKCDENLNNSNSNETTNSENSNVNNSNISLSNVNNNNRVKKIDGLDVEIAKDVKRSLNDENSMMIIYKDKVEKETKTVAQRKDEFVDEKKIEIQGMASVELKSEVSNPLVTNDSSPEKPQLTSPRGQRTPDKMNFGDPRQNQVFEMLTNVQALHHSGQFSDITLKVDEEIFKCHRFVLACNSPVLKKIFSSELDETIETKEDNQPIKLNTSYSSRERPRQREKTITVEWEKDEVTSDKVANVKGISADVFRKVLNFMYCVFEEITTTEESLSLLVAAENLEMFHLSRACALQVNNGLCPNNVFYILRICEEGCHSLSEANTTRRCHQVLRENFSSLSRRSEFLTLNRHHMIALVADSMLHVSGEMEVIQALLRWVAVRPEERSSDLTLMLQHIRFPLMSTLDLDKLSSLIVIRENSLAMALIKESKQYWTLEPGERVCWQRQNSISRILYPSRDLLLWTADRDKGLHLYSVIDGKHHVINSLRHNDVTFDSSASFCCYGDKIFFTGGEFNTDMTWSLDSGTGEVKLHAKMPRGRKFHSMVASRSCIYCLGGQDKRGYTVLDSVEAYLVREDVWVTVGHLAVPAYNMAAVTSGGAIYLLGGLDNTGHSLRIIQCFVALRSGLYSAFKVDIPTMPPSLLSARAVTSGLSGTVYIVCGHGEVYVFEPEKHQLNHVATMKQLSQHPRVRFGLAHIGGCLVVIGGHQLGRTIQEPIKSVCLDITTKSEVRDYSPMLPGDIVNTCVSAKLHRNILQIF